MGKSSREKTRVIGERLDRRGGPKFGRSPSIAGQSQKISFYEEPHFKYYLAASVSVLSFLIYLSSLQNEFVSWDDNSYVYENPHILSFDLAFFRWAFFDFYASNWHPLTWISHALDYAVWGLDPLGHHLTSVILHSVNTFIVVVLVIRLMDIWKRNTTQSSMSAFSDRRAMLITGGITGVLFGLHPLHVESVAWISERKDVLCALFFLLSIMYMTYSSFMDNERDNKRLLFPDRQYWLSLGFFVLALLSKPMAVTLPGILLILDWYPLRRIVSLKSFLSALLSKGPFIMLSLASSALTIQAQMAGNAISSIERAPLWTRVIVAVKALSSYLWKMILPISLSPRYPYPRDVSLFSWEHLPAVILAAVITAACLLMAKRHKLLLVVWCYYVLTLIPVLGFVKVGDQAMADRYTYLPSLSPFFLIGLMAAWLSTRAAAIKGAGLFVKGVSVSIAVIAVVSLSYLTYEQIGIWHSSIDLWNFVIEKEPERVPLAYMARGIAFSKAGQMDKAVQDYDKAIALNPFEPDVFYNRGAAFAKLGRPEWAIEDYSRAIVLIQNGATSSVKATLSLCYAYRGDVYRGIGQFVLAISDFKKACELGSAFGCENLKYYGAAGVRQ